MSREGNRYVEIDDQATRDEVAKLRANAVDWSHVKNLSEAQINDMINVPTRWVSRYDGSYGGNIFDEVKGAHIARVFDFSDGNLIAASPLMLETLRDIRSYFDMKLVGDLREYDNNEDHAVVMTTRRKIAAVTEAIAVATTGMTP